MKKKIALAALAATNASAPTELAKNSTFIDEIEVWRPIPIARRTLFEWRKNGLPVCKVRGRVIYHWPAVENWVLRQQRTAQ